MPAEFRRKLYARGRWFEVTIPKPLLFALDLRGKKYDVLFSYLAETRRWQFRFGERASRKAHTPAEFRRKLYARGDSFETTLPPPLLFRLDPRKKGYDVIFTYLAPADGWQVSISERKRTAGVSRRG